MWSLLSKFMQNVRIKDTIGIEGIGGSEQNDRSSMLHIQNMMSFTF